MFQRSAQFFDRVPSAVCVFIIDQCGWHAYRHTCEAAELIYFVSRSKSKPWCHYGCVYVMCAKLCL